MQNLELPGVLSRMSKTFGDIKMKRGKRANNTVMSSQKQVLVMVSQKVTFTCPVKNKIEGTVICKTFTVDDVLLKWSKHTRSLSWEG